MLRETDCLAARLLGEAGVQLAVVRDELARSVVGRDDPPRTDVPPADRSAVHALVDGLPESALGHAQSMLEQLL
jgi:hypothetical protein